MRDIHVSNSILSVVIVLAIVLTEAFLCVEKSGIKKTVNLRFQVHFTRVRLLSIDFRELNGVL